MAVDLSGTKKLIVAQSEQRSRLAAGRMTDDLKRTAPVDTGKLRRETGVEVISSNQRQIVSRAEIDVEYGSFVIHGTQPHVITGNPLSFYWPKLGRQVFFASVQHPGTAANDFYRNVVSRWSQYLQSA